MGFIRIGCIVKDVPIPENDQSLDNVISSPNLIYKTEDDETPIQVAAKVRLDEIGGRRAKR